MCSDTCGPPYKVVQVSVELRCKSSANVLSQQGPQGTPRSSNRAHASSAYLAPPKSYRGTLSHFGAIIFDNAAPSCMSEMFLPVGQSQVTRRSKNKLIQPFQKSSTGQNGLSYLGPKIWNSLPSELKSATNINSFKHKIKDQFFKNLQSLNDSPYIYY